MPKGVYERTEEMKRRCRERRLRNNGGKWFSEETLQKMSESAKGRRHSEETIERLSENAKQLWEDEDYRHRVSTSVSEVRKGSYRGQETRGCVDGGYFTLCGYPDHPLAINGSLSEHRKVLWEKLGCGSVDCEHECNWCGKLLIWGGKNGIFADHLNGDTLDNRSENLVVSCIYCNFKRVL